MEWASKILDGSIAPGIESFTAAEIPDLRVRFPESKHWLGNHFLNSVFRGVFSAGYHQLAVGYLRRSYYAFAAYHNARDLTYVYLADCNPGNPSVTRVYDILGTWENYFLQSAMSLDLYRRMNKGQGAFANGDGSPFQRVYDTANRIKHTSNYVNPDNLRYTNIVPLWLSNSGFHTYDIVVSYAEASDVLSDISEHANRIQDPLTFMRESPDKS